MAYIGNVEQITNEFVNDHGYDKDELLFIPTVWTFEDFCCEIGELDYEISDYFFSLEDETQKDIIREIMKRVAKNQDHDIGINWTVIRTACEIYLNECIDKI